MKNILFVTSSLNGDDGASSALGADLVERLVDRNPGSRVATLDLDALRLPHLDAAEFRSWSVPQAERTAEQSVLAARSDRLIEQLLEHDTLVMGVPMYNMTVPSTFKAWIDRVVRAGRTFRYTADGPVGLISGIEPYVVFARGGLYRGTPQDTQTGYIQAILGLIGLEPVRTVFAEGLAMGQERREQALREARQAIVNLTEGDEREDRHAAA